MLRPLALALAVCAMLPSLAAAEPFIRRPAAEPAAEPSQPVKRTRIGYGRLITNDVLADGEDRWRTGSFSSSRVWGYRWTGAPPEAIGELLELRLQGQIITPENIANPDPADRPFAGALSVGLHTHFSRGQGEFAVGGDLVVTGPQTKLDEFQDSVHDVLGGGQLADRAREDQIDDDIYPTLVAEAARNIRFADARLLRPFMELRAGDETLLRVGADLTFGGIGAGELQVRDAVTGQRYRVIRSDNSSGFSFVLGGDTAYVADSVYLPEASGYELASRRDRVRAGVHWQGATSAVFYGITWLGKEFEEQDEGQVVGSVRVQLQF